MTKAQSVLYVLYLVIGIPLSGQEVIVAQCNTKGSNKEVTHFLITYTLFIANTTLKVIN